MSGTLPQYRPGSRPKVDETGEIVYRQPRGWGDWHAMKRTLLPGGIFEKGRCVSWTLQIDLRPVHVLDFTPEYHRPSKHARARIRPRTRAEQRRAQRLRARFTQISKSMTVDQNTLGAVHDEVAA